MLICLLDRRGRVVAIGRDTARLAAVTKEIEAEGGEATSVIADYAAPTVVDAAVAAYGHIDVIVSAAGAVQRLMFDEQTAATMARMLRINLMGPLLAVRAALPHLSDGAVVPFVSSTGVMRGNPGLSAHAASKWGFEGAGAHACDRVGRWPCRSRPTISRPYLRADVSRLYVRNGRGPRPPGGGRGPSALRQCAVAGSKPGR